MEIIGEERILIDILTRSITLETYLSLRLVSKKIKELVELYTQRLNKDKENQILNPNILLKMKNIKEIDAGIIIPVEYYLNPLIRSGYQSQLISLICHETLSSATFKMIDIKLGIKSFMKHFKPNGRKYNFTFVDRVNSNSYLCINNTRLTLHQMRIDPDNDLYTTFCFNYHVQELYVDCCHYNMFDFSRERLFDRIIFDYVDDHCGSRYLERIISNRLTYREASEYYLIVNQSSLKRLIATITSCIHLLDWDTRRYPNVKRFFPLPANYIYLSKIQDIFPNLESISLFARTIKGKNITSNLINFLDTYPEIVIYRESNDTNTYFLDQRLVDKIKFATIDQRS